MQLIPAYVRAALRDSAQALLSAATTTTFQTVQHDTPGIQSDVIGFAHTPHPTMCASLYQLQLGLRSARNVANGKDEVYSKDSIGRMSCSVYVVVDSSWQ